MGEVWNRIMKHFGGRVVGKDYAFVQEIRYEMKKGFPKCEGCFHIIDDIGTCSLRTNFVRVLCPKNKWFVKWFEDE